MREWQVGDPIGDGNDIGIPDIAYMDYLKNGEESKDNPIYVFSYYMSTAKSFFDDKDEEMAFSYIKSAFEFYEKLNDIDKSHIDNNSFNEYWVLYLCCKTINKHGSESSDALEIIKKYHFRNMKFCIDCDCIYPYDYTHCSKCGKEFEKRYKLVSDQIVKLIKDVMITRVYDLSQIDRLIERSFFLMESNDCGLVDIKYRNYGADFIFVKEHIYFKTIYECAFVSKSGPRIFEDFSVKHDHEKLQNNRLFQKLIYDCENKTGFKFKNIDGGYGSNLDETHFDFEFNEKINIIVRFDMGNGKTAVYDLDLDNMKLSEEYRVF